MIDWKKVEDELPKKYNIMVLVKIDTYPYEKNPNAVEDSYRSAHFRDDTFFMGVKAEFKLENEFEYFESDYSYIEFEYEKVKHKLTHWAYINKPKEE